ncbi:MAG: hypothetical protein QF491_08125, partial [Alphaproteobacteria bacterium]|nr:hypothetical protein [Alphaproteobacteria bacterium]
KMIFAYLMGHSRYFLFSCSNCQMSLEAIILLVQEPAYIAAGVVREIALYFRSTVIRECRLSATNVGQLAVWVTHAIEGKAELCPSSSAPRLLHLG